MEAGIHLHFDGQCQAAFEFYAELLGASVDLMIAYSDSPMANDVPPHWRDKIVHASLRLGDIEIAGADVQPEDYQRPAGFHILLQVRGADQAESLFDSLAQGGSITLPLQETFWSPCYGTLVDQFGVPWEINSAG